MWLVCGGRTCQGMLWVTARNGKRIPGYVAPSWSWACMMTPVSYPNDFDSVVTPGISVLWTRRFLPPKEIRRKLKCANAK